MIEAFEVLGIYYSSTVKLQSRKGNEDIFGVRYFDPTFDTFPADSVDHNWISQGFPRQVKYPFVRYILHRFHNPIFFFLLLFPRFLAYDEKCMLDLLTNRD